MIHEPKGPYGRKRVTSSASTPEQRVRQRMRPRKNDEEMLHRRVVALLRELDLAFFHVPNASRAPAQYRAKMNAMGLSRGVPDLIIVAPPPSLPDRVGAVMELKTSSGALSLDQRQWLQKFHDLGWAVAVPRSLDEVEALLETWGYM